MLSPKENYLKAIRFSNPDYVPLTNEDQGRSIPEIRT